METFFSVMILIMLFFALYSLLEAANVVFQTNTVNSRLNSDVMQSLRSISREFSQSNPGISPARVNVTQDANGNSILRFQVPVDWDGDGDAVDAQGRVEWGSFGDIGNVQTSQLGGWIQYSVNGTQLVHQVLDSAQIPIPDQSRVVLRNLSTQGGAAFTVTTPAGLTDQRDINVRLRATDLVGQNGQARAIGNNYSLRVFLRNKTN